MLPGLSLTSKSLHGTVVQAVITNTSAFCKPGVGPGGGGGQDVLLKSHS